MELGLGYGIFACISKLEEFLIKEGWIAEVQFFSSEG